MDLQANTGLEYSLSKYEMIKIRLEYGYKNLCSVLLLITDWSANIFAWSKDKTMWGMIVLDLLRASNLYSAHIDHVLTIKLQFSLRWRVGANLKKKKKVASQYKGLPGGSLTIARLGDCKPKWQQWVGGVCGCVFLPLSSMSKPDWVSVRSFGTVVQIIGLHWRA